MSFLGPNIDGTARAVSLSKSLSTKGGLIDDLKLSTVGEEGDFAKDSSDWCRIVEMARHADK